MPIVDFAFYLLISFRHVFYIIPNYSMVTTGIDTNGSQFYVSLGVAKQLNGRSVVFGRMIEGESVLKAIEEVGVCVYHSFRVQV